MMTIGPYKLVRAYKKNWGIKFTINKETYDEYFLELLQMFLNLKSSTVLPKLAKILSSSNLLINQFYSNKLYFGNL